MPNNINVFIMNYFFHLSVGFMEIYGNVTYNYMNTILLIHLESKEM